MWSTHTQLVSLLMALMLRDIALSIDSLAMGWTPPNFIRLSLVQNILATAARDLVTTLQANLAYILESAVPIYVNQEMRDIGVIVNLPKIASENIYQLKTVVNVGIWQKYPYNHGIQQ